MRLYNVLHRLARVLDDSRVRWTPSELALVRHFAALLGAIAQIWVQREWMPEGALESDPPSIRPALRILHREALLVPFPRLGEQRSTAR